MKVIISKTENIQKEIRRKKWMRQARKQKKRWISRALNEKRLLNPSRWRKVAAGVCSFCLWAGLGVFMLVVSWALFLQTGESSFDYSSVLEETEDKEEGQKFRIQEINKESKEAWSKEIFGVELRIQDGKIIFFQEKKEKVMETE